MRLPKTADWRKTRRETVRIACFVIVWLAFVALYLGAVVLNDPVLTRAGLAALAADGLVVLLS